MQERALTTPPHDGDSLVAHRRVGRTSRLVRKRWLSSYESSSVLSVVCESCPANYWATRSRFGTIKRSVTCWWLYEDFKSRERFDWLVADFATWKATLIAARNELGMILSLIEMVDPATHFLHTGQGRICQSSLGPSS